MTTYRFIHVEEANHAVRLLCRVLEVSRSAYYAWRAGETHTQKRSDRQLLVHIRAIHRRHKGRYGAPRITAELREQGFMVNRKRVARGDVRGAIHHTDRGSQYASRAYRERIAKAGMGPA